jgi:dihydrofolate synthase/folylpolyglutamate synthase
VDVAVLEVGLGGRLDATNVVEQSISVITPIDVDHADVLGTDPPTIAREKAGIIKPRQVVLTAPQPQGVEEVVQEVVQAQGASLAMCGRDLTAGVERHDLGGITATITGLRGIYESLALPLIGRHQAENAALAIGALEALSPTGIPSRIVERGLAHVDWPGRLEVVNDEPLIIMDGAHNPHAAAALRGTLQELCAGRAIHLLVGMSSDKSVEDFGALVGSLAVSATCTKSHHPRALDPTELANRLFRFCPDVHVMSDPIDAYTYLLNAVSPRDVVVVTGSLFLVGELRAAIRQSHVIPSRRRGLPMEGTRHADDHH